MDMSKITKTAKDIFKNAKARMIIVWGLAGAFVYFVFLQDSGEDVNKKEQYRPMATDSVLGVNSSVERMNERELQQAQDKIAADFNAKEQQLAQERAEHAKRMKELEDRNAEMMAKFSKMQGDFDHYMKMKRLQQQRDAEKGAQRSQGGNQRVVATGNGQQNVEQDPNNQGVFYKQPTQLIPREPLIFDNDIIRTVTQRTVTEVKENGKMEIRDTETVTFTGSGIEKSGTGVIDTSPRTHNPSVNDNDNGEFALTMGSIISGTIMNGVAASTGVNAAANPVPVMLRVKGETLMPNNFVIDLKDCFLLAESRGTLNDERVHLRANAISCITENGQAIERSLQAYAVSRKDGMAGIGGKIISRSRSMISNTLVASFIGGFADAASPRSINSVNTEPTTSTLWQSQNLDRFAGAGVLSGTSDALERLSQYYVDIIEQQAPVIEIIPGQSVDFMVTRGVTLNLNGARQGGPIGQGFSGLSATPPSTTFSNTESASNASNNIVSNIANAVSGIVSAGGQ
ncbi:MAG: hypothetical protein GJ680_07430 [Alteromonadaceae bacterium]|nr:hypothetical protein [Alteromonadaceae bacterium]